LVSRNTLVEPPPELIENKFVHLILRRRRSVPSHERIGHCLHVRCIGRRPITIVFSRNGESKVTFSAEINRCTGSLIGIAGFPDTSLGLQQSCVDRAMAMWK
jgi:hypothetical protein